MLSNGRGLGLPRWGDGTQRRLIPSPLDWANIGLALRADKMGAMNGSNGPPTLNLKRFRKPQIHSMAAPWIPWPLETFLSSNGMPKVMRAKDKGTFSQ